jgi:hypothetical protein
MGSGGPGLVVRDHAGERPDGWTAPGQRLVRSAATERVPSLAELGRVHSSASRARG